MTEPVKRPRGRPPRPEEETKQALLQSAMDVLLEGGYEAATMEAIAKRAAVAKKTVAKKAVKAVKKVAKKAAKKAQAKRK